MKEMKFFVNQFTVMHVFFFYSLLIIIPSNSFIEEQQQLICSIKENSAKIQILKFLDMAKNFNSLKSEYPLL